MAKAFEGNVVWAGTVVKYAPADKDGPAWYAILTQPRPATHRWQSALAVIH